VPVHNRRRVDRAYEARREIRPRHRVLASVLAQSTRLRIIIRPRKTLAEYQNQCGGDLHEAMRVLRDDGVMWLVMGDCFVDKDLQMVPRNWRWRCVKRVDSPSRNHLGEGDPSRSFVRR